MPELSFELKGLNCANCAAKIEKEVNGLEYVDSANLIFASQKLNLKVSQDTSVEDIQSAVKDIVKSHEPSVEVLYNNIDQSPVNSGSANIKGILGGLVLLKNELILLAAGLLFYIVGIAAAKGTYLELPFFLLAYLACGYDVLLFAGKNILKGRVFDENFLMSIATIGAFAVGEYPEAAGVMLFYKTGELLQSLAVNKSRRSIKSLLDLKPAFANLKTDNGISHVAPESLKVGDIIVIKPGERVPSDSIIIEGTSFLDTSSLTGEPVPRQAGPGDHILGGFVNNNGLLVAKVETLLKESAVSRIMDLVENAASRKAHVENFITRFAAWYTPVVVILAVLTALLPPLVTGSMDFKLWIYRSLIFLVISCPCALVISVPLTFFAGIGLASSKGILIKGSNYLEALADADTFVFDKTGTLTKGIFKVTEIKTAVGFTEESLLELAAIAETHSSHPAAKALIEEFNENINRKASNTRDGSVAANNAGQRNSLKDSDFDQRISDYREIAGMGIKAVIDGSIVLVGSKKLLTAENTAGEMFENTHGTAVHVAVDGNYAGMIIISDVLKPDAAAAIEGLRKNGASKIIMLTGDNKAAAEKIAGQLRLDSVYSELLPHQKSETLDAIKAESAGKVVFTGDGINDSPVLALSDVGVSMGSIGSDAAIEASDIVLMTDEPVKLVEAVNIARKTKAIAWQNIVFSLLVKAVIMIIGIAGIANMWEAVFADVGVTLIAVFNSLRILYHSGS